MFILLNLGTLLEEAKGVIDSHRQGHRFRFSGSPKLSHSQNVGSPLLRQVLHVHAD
jgi:hypothetical protein